MGEDCHITSSTASKSSLQTFLKYVLKNKETVFLPLINMVCLGALHFPVQLPTFSAYWQA